MNFQNTIIRQVNEGFPVQSIYLDIEKAFDTVWVEGLVYKMLQFGFDRYICRYILFYASQRKFAIKINNFVSELHSIPNGLPQGAIFSPIGWAIYVADMPIFNSNNGTRIKLSQYADDTAIVAFNRNHNYGELEEDINNYLNQ